MDNPNTPAPLALAINHVNAIRSATGQMLLALDKKRPCAWAEYGWPENVDFGDFKRLYDRQGIAYGVINRLAGKCWETSPRIIQGEEAEKAQPESPWEKTARRALKKARFWKGLYEADKRRLVGGWSGLLLRTADDSARSAWDQPIKGNPVLVGVIPAWRSQLTPTLDADGEPLSWQYQEDDVEQGARNFTVHPDRIIILGDWRAGVSLLRACYNAFVNLEKISGGSGESFLKNAARQLGINFDAETDLNTIASAYGVKPNELQEVFNDTARRINRGTDSVLATQGAQVSTLVSTVPDPAPHYGVSLQEVSAALEIPVKIIVGMQTGERASVEDIRDFNRRCQGRRVQVLSYDMEDAVDHLIRIKVIDPVDEFYIHWSDLAEAAQAEKLEAADKMATINQKNAGTGEPAPFSADEIRQAAGFEAMEDSDPRPENDPAAQQALAEQRMREAAAQAAAEADA